MELEREKSAVNGFGIASLVLGIVAVLMICFSKCLALIFGIIGLVFGILGITVLKDSKKGVAIAGTIISGITLLLVLVLVVGSALGIFGKKNSGGNSYSVHSSSSNPNVASDADEYPGASSYEDNKYFEITSIENYHVTSGTVFIHKYKGKKNSEVTGTMFIYDNAGNAIGKDTNTVSVIEGKEGFFKYFVEKDPEDIGEFSYDAKAKSKNWSSDDIAGVEMTKYNVSGDDLYISLVQNAEELDSFSKFKVLMYKNGKLVDSDFGYFNTSARNLTGKGSTDIVEIDIWRKEVDRIEYYYEP